MRFIPQKAEIIDFSSPYTIYEASKACYRSAHDGDDLKMYNYIKARIKAGHESVLEHSLLTVRFTTNRAIANELVRHRHCAFSQESTRYVKFTTTTDMEFIHPIIDDTKIPVSYHDIFGEIEEKYKFGLLCGASPEELRGMLPLDLATTLWMSTNYREWRSVLKLRLDKHAHPQMRELMFDLAERIRKIDFIYPLFEDIIDKEESEDA